MIKINLIKTNKMNNYYLTPNNKNLRSKKDNDFILYRADYLMKEFNKTLQDLENDLNTGDLHYSSGGWIFNK